MVYLKYYLSYTEKVVFELGSNSEALTWSMIFVSAEKRLRISPRGVVSKNLGNKQIRMYDNTKLSGTWTLLMDNLEPRKWEGSYSFAQRPNTLSKVSHFA